MAIQVLNCIITPPYDPFTILFVKTKTYNDLSLPGKTALYGVDNKELLTESIKEKSDVSIDTYKDTTFSVEYEVGGEKFERIIFVAGEYTGIPTTRGDMTKYGIEIYGPRLIFTPEWEIKRGYKFAPGIRQVVMKYYATVPGIEERYPEFRALSEAKEDEG